jgi:hypothetical protein
MTIKRQIAPSNDCELRQLLSRFFFEDNKRFIVYNRLYKIQIKYFAIREVFVNQIYKNRELNYQNIIKK